MTLVLAGICWVKRGFWSSNNMNSCWLDESALFVVAAVKSKRWNQPSAPTATTKFCQTGKRKQDTHNVVNIATKVFMICICRLNLPFLCCRRLQPQHRSAATVKHMRWIRETNSLWNRERFLVCVLTMPTQVLVIQGLESSFLYTSNFPLVSPTTSSFNYSEWRQTAHSFCYNMEETNI